LSSHIVKKLGIELDCLGLFIGLDTHTHGCLDDFWRSLNGHVRILDLVIILVGHLSQVRVDVVEAFFVLLKDKIVVVLVHLGNLSLLFQLFLFDTQSWLVFLLLGGLWGQARWNIWLLDLLWPWNKRLGFCVEEIFSWVADKISCSLKNEALEAADNSSTLRLDSTDRL